jgi:hypothetical protein
MFNYDPMTEEQAMRERYSLMPKGRYAGVIKKCLPRVSPNGNSMFDMDIDFYDGVGAVHTVRDFLVFSNKMMWKVIHCADSAGLSKEYEEKKFCPEILVNRNIVADIDIQTGNEIPEDKLRGKPIGTCYPDKNVVEDYIKLADQTTPDKQAIDPQLNDDVPF